MGSANFCGFRDQNSHRFRDQGSNFWVKIWDQLRKNIPHYDPDKTTLGEPQTFVVNTTTSFGSTANNASFAFVVTVHFWSIEV